MLAIQKIQIVSRRSSIDSTHGGLLNNRERDLQIFHPFNSLFRPGTVPIVHAANSCTEEHPICWTLSLADICFAYGMRQRRMAITSDKQLSMRNPSLGVSLLCNNR